MERAPIIIAKMVPVIIARMITMERILVASEYKKSGKNGCYRHY